MVLNPANLAHWHDNDPGSRPPSTRTGIIDVKLYSFQPAPNPRRTRIFIAEKGLDIPVVEVNLREGEQNDPEFEKKNPCRTVPTLELDDGNCIAETMAICRYLDELHPEPCLLGSNAVERAMVTGWNRRIEFEGMMALAEALRNHSPFFADRALPGPYPVAQISDLVGRGMSRAERFFDMLNERLGQSPHVAGEQYSMADISALVTVDFAGWVKLEARAGRDHLDSWYQRVAARPAASA
jgi:glutathione S-transferase